MAYEIQSEKEPDDLQAYDVGNYQMKMCEIKVKAGRCIYRRTFERISDKNMFKEAKLGLKD